MPDKEIIIRDGDTVEAAQLVPDEINITIVEGETTQHLYESLKTILQAGDNVTITTNDTARSFTFASTGGGGGQTELAVRSISSSIHDQEIVLVITYTDGTSDTQRIDLPAPPTPAEPPYRLYAYKSLAESDPNPSAPTWTETSPPTGWVGDVPNDVNTDGRKVFESHTTYTPSDQTFTPGSTPVRISPQHGTDAKSVTAIHLTVSGQELTAQINFSDGTNVSDSVTLPGGSGPPPTPNNITVYYGAVPLANPISQTGMSHVVVNIAATNRETVTFNYSEGDEVRFLLPHDHPLTSLMTTTLSTPSLQLFAHTENALTIDGVSYDSYKRGVDFAASGTISYIMGIRSGTRS